MYGVLPDLYVFFLLYYFSLLWIFGSCLLLYHLVVIVSFSQIRRSFFQMNLHEWRIVGVYLRTLNV